MRGRRNRALLAALAALLAVLVAGCGGSSTLVPELTSLSQVADKSSAVDSARFALAFDITLPGTESPVAFSADGAFDTTAKRADLNVDLSSVTELAKTMGATLGGAAEQDLGSAEDWKLELIQDGDTAYVRFPLISKQLPAGKTWIKGDAKDLSSAKAGRLSQLGSLAGIDPRDVFGVLRAVSGSIEPVGNEEIRGVETSHYRATLDAAKIAGLVPEAQRQSLGGLDESMLQAVSQLPLDIWIDADQRVRKLSIVLEAKQPLVGSAKASLTVEIYDYGKPVELQLPPADQVVDAATLKKP